MIALQIKNTRQFMSTLLASESFDGFLMDSAELKIANTYMIDGHVNEDFFGEDESDKSEYDLSTWKSLRPVCYELIKGKRTPVSFKFILCLTPDKKEQLLGAELSGVVSSLVFIIRFSEGHIIITTGVALSGFTLDKSYEKIWDDYMKRFLSGINVEYEEI
ncbi:DUF5721 family protein [Butyrivibrio sp. JL13D10]|uniref:DUF5721 family protein n=1 Tax=Butyrivibrio sp. JL13D10 TaxID=3236815 RepID=UPI0038B55F25